MDNMLERLKGGLIVSCYAGADFNAEMGVPETMVCVAKSCIAGGAKAIRTNCENVAAIKAAVDVPVIGLKKDIPQRGHDQRRFPHYTHTERGGGADKGGRRRRGRGRNGAREI